MAQEPEPRGGAVDAAAAADAPGGAARAGAIGGATDAAAAADAHGGAARAGAIGGAADAAAAADAPGGAGGAGGPGDASATGSGPAQRPPLRPIQGNRHGRSLAVLGIVAVIGILVGTILSTPATGVRGIAPGTRVPPFAAPLALGDLHGEVDIAVHAHEGHRGRVAACRERGPKILNICQLYERGPVVLVLFVDEGACPNVLAEMQAVSASFPKVGFAAVAIKAESPEVRTLIAKRRIGFPVGVSPEGELAPLYELGSCPQVSFIYPGGRVQSRALLVQPSRSVLRARVSELLAASKARGWRPRA